MEKNYDELLNEANELYLKSKVIDGNSIDPITWICNQNKLRSSWEMFVEKSNNLGVYKPIIMENEFSKYMKFMYDSFPAGYCDIINKNIIENNEIKKMSAYEKTKEWRKKKQKNIKNKTKENIKHVK
jgi:hypothetical protein